MSATYNDCTRDATGSWLGRACLVVTCYMAFWSCVVLLMFCERFCIACLYCLCLAVCFIGTRSLLVVGWTPLRSWSPEGLARRCLMTQNRSVDLATLPWCGCGAAVIR